MNSEVIVVFVKNCNTQYMTRSYSQDEIAEITDALARKEVIYFELADSSSTLAVPYDNISHLVFFE